MQDHKVVSREQWLEARRELLAKEKEFTRQRDQLSQQRRELPWVKVDKEYTFDSPHGKESLADLFGDKSQLIVYHFMLGPEWENPCKSCSFWADNYDGIDVHLRHRDVSFVTISRAPLTKIQSCQERMGWNFKWVSSFHNDFNFDYHVSFTQEQLQEGEVFYNFKPGKFPTSEAPGISVFTKDDKGQIFHTYSTYARGLDMLNGAYHYLDITPKGRDEAHLSYPMAWLRLHDQYEDN